MLNQSLLVDLIEKCISFKKNQINVFNLNNIFFGRGPYIIQYGTVFNNTTSFNKHILEPE